MSDLIMETLDVSQLALSTVEMYMCSEDVKDECDEVKESVEELKEINSFLLESYDNDSGLTPKVIISCDRVATLWVKIKSQHSIIILKALLKQYYLAKEGSQDFVPSIVEDLNTKINKFEDLLAEIQSGQEVKNNTYHILMEMQERIHQ